MTVGSNVHDDRVQYSKYDTGYYAGENLCGKLRTKTWNGTDSVPIIIAPREKKFYTTVDRRGRRVKRAYWTAPKRAKPTSFNPFTASGVETFEPVSEFTLTGDYGGTRTFTGYAVSSLFGTGPQYPTWTPDAEYKLIGRLKESVRGSDFNMATFLGEGHETLRMIGDAAIRIARGLHLLRKGNVTGAILEMSRSASKHPLYRRSVENVRRRGVEQVASNLLEVRWGWMPLLHDMRSAAEMLSHRLNVPYRQRHRARVTLKGVVPGGIYHDWSDAICLYSKQIVAEFSEPESIPKLLGLLDPEVLAWELAPLSCLVDYVVPIGGWLEARAFASSLSGKFCRTEYKRARWGGLTLGKIYVRVPGYPSSFSGSGKGAYGSTFSINRTVVSSLDVPKPVVRPLSQIASFRNTTNALAVLALVAERPLKRAEVDVLLRKDYPPSELTRNEYLLHEPPKSRSRRK